MQYETILLALFSDPVIWRNAPEAPSGFGGRDVEEARTARRRRRPSSTFPWIP